MKKAKKLNLKGKESMAKDNMTEDRLRAMGLVQGKDGMWFKPSMPQPRDITLKSPIVKKIKKGRTSLDLAFAQLKETVIEAHAFTSKEKPLIFEWAGKHISLNEWYSSKHWSHRNRIAREWHNFFLSFLRAPYPKFEKYKISLAYNSILDPSNTITLIKLCEDMLQWAKVINNDNKANCKGISITPDESMKKKSYKIVVEHA